MSRWFRHYAGMMRDDKLVGAAIRAKQPVERVVWVWGAILESASEINDGGRYEFDVAEVAYFLRVDEADICAIVDALTKAGRLDSGIVVNWSDRQENLRPPAHEWRIIRDRIFARDDYTCRYCQTRGIAIECDHIIPVARGGGHEDANLLTACKYCNRAKRDRTPKEMGWTI